ncbi:MAG TPA: thioredoxin domain-containing protein [Steroidobacteraceae bacterium]|nr:thioredoxin domain-containing protein [Steroidobacteraceae bacterium]
MQRNRLAAETSPYLLQHADNPVDWYPWGEEALAIAQRDNKPILLSVGYSACHWCHVMAHESFEDPAIAALMNRLFVNIKVDREERPDLDRIYQVAQQLITQRNGGWPLTMFLAPEDQRPFFGGTYFPKVPTHGMPGFTDILRRVAEYFTDHGAEIRQQNAQLAQAFERLTPGGATGDVLLDESPLRAARRVMEESFDSRFGGFGRAPKFPQPASIERCLRHWYRTSQETDPDLKALYMATLTLTRMAEGGLFDQLGGGFSRYSVDEFWMIPHFEKMLYDNGQLLHSYACANLATGESLFARIAGETADWLLRDMRSPEGGFYSSLDADSEGHEGSFYVWNRAEVEALLTPLEYSIFARRFGLDKDANFEGRWHLHTHESLEAVAPLAAGTPAATLQSAHAKLLAARNLRVWPARDEKILTSWNALTIKGLAVAGRALNRPDLTAAAAAAVDFIRHKLWRDGRLLATYKDGRAHVPAYLDDYAFLADALLELLQSRWRSSDLEFARSLIEVLLTKFEDSAGGGFYFTASDHEQLIHRSKTFSDDSLPSGNGIAASVLCRMGYLLGEPRYLNAAERTFKAAWSVAAEFPQAHMSVLNALEDFLSSTQVLIIRGPADDAGRWARNLGALYAPARMIFAIPDDAPDLPAALADKPAGADVMAYVCTGMTCGAPLTDLGELARKLASRINS